MYAWIWKQLPGPWPMKAVLAVVLLAIVVLVLFVWVFPWLEPRLPFNDVTVDETPSASATSSLVLGLHR